MLQVSHIQRFCLHDGPGIRTTVFLQGCALGCWWCHNPEYQPAEAEHATAWTETALADELERDQRWWRASGGGVTVSGGEPLCQADGLARLLELLGRRSTHRAVETAGAVGPDAVAAVADRVDLWLFDLKAVDAEMFRSGTGGDVTLSLATLAALLDRRPPAVRVRITLVRGFNAETAAVQRIGRWLCDQPRRPQVELLAGHDVTKPGVDRTGWPVASPRVDREQVEEARRVLRDMGLEVG